MTRFSIEPRDIIFVKACKLLSFSKNIGKKIGQSLSKNVRGKYSQKKLFGYVKQSATDVFKTASEKSVEKITRIA